MDKSLICQLILAFVSLWLLVNSFKETFEEKCASDFFIYFIIVWLLFNQGYDINDWLDFILIVIKWDYNINDRLKFILSTIRRDNGLNKQLKAR